MAGLWYRAGTVTVTTGSAKVTGFGTVWKSGANKPDKGHTFWGPDGKHYELDYVESDTVLYLVKQYAGQTASGQYYEIDTTRTSTIPALSREVSALLAYAQGQYDGWQSVLTGSGDVVLTAPDGQQVIAPSLANMLSKSGNLEGLKSASTARRNLGISVFADTLLDDTDAAGMRATLGLVKQTLPTDMTSGAMLINGAWGLGSTAVDAGTDLSATETRLARFMRINSSASGAPTASTSTGAVVLPIDGGPTSAIIASAFRRAFFGHRLNNGSVSWTEAWTKENLSYEVGTFTPVLVGAGSAGSGTYTVQIGRYTRIAGRIFFDISIALTAHSGSGGMRINGMPFISNGSSSSYQFSVYHSNLTTSLPVSAIMGGNSSQIVLRTLASGSTPVDVAMDSSCDLRISGCYEI